MRAILTVVGRDTVGILQDMFCMIMLADMSACTIPFTAFADKAQALGEEMNLSVHAMHEDIFNSMHRI